MDLADGNLKEAEIKLGQLEGDESRVLIEGIEKSFYELASEEIELIKKNTATE